MARPAGAEDAIVIVQYKYIGSQCLTAIVRMYGTWPFEEPQNATIMCQLFYISMTWVCTILYLNW